MIANYPYAACPYAEALAARSEAFRRQITIDPREAECAPGDSEDPFSEETSAAGCPGLKQRFPDRVLIMTSDSCFMNCRHCTRRNLLHRAFVVRDEAALATCIDYVKQRPAVRDVLLSGGDVLMLPDSEVMRFVEAFAALDQIDVIRLCTRALAANPTRITPTLVSALAASDKVWVNTQFNHPDEITPEATAACKALVHAGIPVSCQTVLLAGVNDDPETLLALFRALQRARVRPYYVFQCDPVAGTSHFRVPLERAREIEAACARAIGGLGLPRFVADVPGADRKIPISEL